MKIDLSGQHAVVTGAAKGIGAEIARHFVGAGASVTALDVDKEGLRSLQEEFPNEVNPEVLDVTDENAIARVIASLSIDHLVCSAAAGSGKPASPFWNQVPGDWNRVLEVTLLGTVRMLHACAPKLLEGDTNRKSVALIASVAGQMGSQTDPPYSAAKAAVINFSQAAAKDFAPFGVRVNSIAPGMVRTELNHAVYEANRLSENETFEEWGEKKLKLIAPLGRWQEASEIAATAVYLASDFARNITGQTINVDGGQVMHS